MNKITLTTLAALCASAAFAADYNLNSAPADSPLDITDTANWNGTVTGDTTNHRLNINNSNGYMDGTGQTFEISHLMVNGNSSFKMTGSGNTITGTNAAGNTNTNWGNSANGTTVIDILGSGNNVSLNTGNSWIFGAYGSVENGTTFTIDSSSVLARNSFTISGSNSFLQLSTNAASTAVQKITIGDYSDFIVKTSFRFGGESGSALAGGQLIMEMKGTGSLFDSKTAGRAVEMFNQGGGGMTGGTLKIDVGGNTNTFKSANLNMGNRGTASIMTGGNILFDVSGINNKVAIDTITIGDSNNTGGSVKFEVSGTNNSINTGIINVNNLGTLEVSGKSDGLEIGTSGEYGSMKTGNVTVNAGGTVVVHGGAYLDMSNASMYVKANGTLELIANEDGFFRDGSTTNMALQMVNMLEFDGILSLDFSHYVLQSADGNYETVKLMYVNNRNINVDSLNDGTIQVDFDKNNFDLGLFAWDGNVLTVQLMAIPEPSTYAAILGALALAFVAYRRRK